MHFPSYFITWKKGIATTRLADDRYAPIGRRAGLERLPKYLEAIGMHGFYDGRYDDLGLLLVRGEVPAPLAPSLSRFRLLETRGPWRLYENTARRRSIPPPRATENHPSSHGRR